MWFQKNKWKVIIPVLVVAILAGAFYFGGNAPGSKGWTVNKPPVDSQQNQQDDDQIDQKQGEIADPSKDNDSQIDPKQDDDPVTGQEDGKEPVNQDPVTGQEDGKEPANQDPVKDPVTGQEDGKEPITSESPAVTDGNTQPIEDEPQNPVETETSVNTPTMVIDPKTGKDKYNTDPVPEGKPLPVEPQNAQIGEKEYSCTLSIACTTILDNMDYCDEEKKELVPEDGWILKPITVKFYEGESVFDVLRRTCKQKKIHMEYENTPMYNSAYIEGIHNLYEFDVGQLSGWMYSVNGWFPNYGCSRYALKDGDVICWVYTCDLGYDVGGGYAVGAN